MSSTLPTDYWARVVYLVTHYSASFLRGAGSTLLIALVGTFVGCLIGFAVGIVQTIPVSKQDSIIKRALLFIVKLILNIYVEVFRGTPMIVQAMFIYFGAMQYLGITMGMWFAAFFIVSSTPEPTWQKLSAAEFFPLTKARPRLLRPLE